MLGKFLKVEFRRSFTKPFFIIAVSVLVCLTLAACIYYKVSPNDNSNKTVYGITEYETFEELEQKINDTAETLKREKEAYETAKETGAFGKDKLAAKRQNIEYLETGLNTMKLLYEKRINFNRVLEYRDFDSGNGAGAAISFICLAAIAVSILSAMRLAFIVPSEIKDGQAKLTMILSIGRINYVIYKLISQTLQALAVLTAYSLLALALSAAFFPVKESFVIFAAPKGAFCLPIYLNKRRKANERIRNHHVNRRVC